MKKTTLAIALSLALVAAGVATAAAVTHQSSGSVAASGSNGTVILRPTNLGKVLATKSGMTLYLFMADRQGRSNCYGQCATFWPPLLKKGKVSVGAGLKAKLLAVTKRKNGTRQLTYNGHPLYRFKLDKGAGQTKGEGQDFFGGKWYVLSAAGKAVKTAPPAGTTTNTTTTNPYGY
jgi:predicted lipoprotein with Yx(FWY)xxD motif